MEFFGHLIRKEELEELVVPDFDEERKALWRPSVTYLTYLQKRKDLTPIKHIQFAYDIDVWFELSK